MIDFEKKPLTRGELSVADLYEHLTGRLNVDVQRLNDVPMKRMIKERDIHRPGLALAGFTNLFTHWRVQIFGNTEVQFIEHLPLEARQMAFSNIFHYEMPCIFITDGNKVEPKLIEMATDKSVPIFLTTLTTTKLIYLISDFLDDQFSPYQSYHGSMMDVYGIGILFVGRSGIGKSEIALDLIERGHRLVSDDRVMITRKGESVLMAAGEAGFKHFMEIRGLGIIDVRAMFGVRAIRYQKRVEVVVELMEWDSQKSYERLGLDTKTVDILGVAVPHVLLPIYPGKNITVIAEVVALNYLLKHYGYDSAKAFEKNLSEMIARKTMKPKKRSQDEPAIRYFEHDFE
ncbi:MAG: HPr(Ser) kinase/phosphatase [Chloroherpetonaceae bacterium]|nr:HPr(Ser) kinase/phosphatase [Chloroherpetonaceae bacterium]